MPLPFSDGANKILADSKSWSKQLKQDYIGTEHILLSLLGTNSTLLSCLLKYINPVKVKEEIQNELQFQPPADVAMIGNIPFTPAAARTVKQVAEEAKAMNHAFVGAEHFMLALLNVNEGLAAVVLKKLGVDAKAVYGEMVDFLYPHSNSSPERKAEPERESLQKQHLIVFVALGAQKEILASKTCEMVLPQDRNAAMQDFIDSVAGAASFKVFDVGREIPCKVRWTVKVEIGE